MFDKDIIKRTSIKGKESIEKYKEILYYKNISL